MDWLDALILGIVQGLTEFLPVSSSGHLEIGQALLHTASEEHLTFTVAVHVATVLSTVCVFWKDLLQLLKGCCRFAWNDETRYVATILVSMIPVLVVGLFFKDTVEQFFGNGLRLTGAMLLVTALLLFTAHKCASGTKKDIPFKDAFIIGIAQACAVLPGLSRSGATISTGLLLGNKKENVARFSFLMVLAPILGEALLDGMEIGQSAASGIGLLPLAVGFVAAFVSGFVACRWMLSLVRRSKLIWFAVYCAVIGLFTLFILS